MKQRVNSKILRTSLLGITLTSLMVAPITAPRSAQATEQERLAADTQQSIVDREQYQVVSQLSSTDETEIWFDDPETEFTDAETDLEDFSEGMWECRRGGFDLAVLTVPEIGSIQEFQQFVARIRSIEDEELVEDEELMETVLRYYPTLIDAKNLAIMAAADQMLLKVNDEEAIFDLHAVKFKEFRNYRFSSDEAQAQFELYAEELSQHPIKQVRSLPEGHDLLIATVFTAIAQAPEDMHMDLVQNLFDYIDEYGVNEVTADITESISLMYDADSYPNLTPVLFQGLAERFEQAPNFQEIATRYRAQAEALTDN